MYLIIMEDSTVWQADTISDDERSAADDGILDIIDISGPQPTQYHDNNWHGINHWPTTGE